jgi:hypothetical protein
MLLLDYWRHSGVIVGLAVCFIFSIKSQRPWRLTKGNAEMRNMSKKTWKLRVRSHMTEMQKLDILLKHAKVPHTYGRRWPEMDRPDNPGYLPGGKHDGGEQIVVYDAGGNRIWDGVWGWGSYGFEQGLIEVMGTQLLGHDDVEGWLTARQVTKMWRCGNAAKNR